MTVHELLKAYGLEHNNMRVVIRNQNNSETIKDTSMCLLYGVEEEETYPLQEKVAHFSVIGHDMDDNGVVCRYSMLINLDEGKWKEQIW